MVDRQRTRGGYVGLALVALAFALATAVWFGMRGGSDDRPRGSAGEPDPPSRGTARAPIGPGGYRSQDPGDPAADPSTPTVAGQIVDSDGAPLTEGGVELWCVGEPRLAASARLDDEGRFVGPSCGDSTCVRLAHPYYAAGQVLEPGEVATISARANPRLAGVVVSPTGDPVGDAWVSLRGGLARGRGHTDTDGAFELPLGQPRVCDPCDAEPVGCVAENTVVPEVEITVQAPGFGPLHTAVGWAVIVERAEIELRLPAPTPALAGEVLDADGRPFVGRTRVLARSHDYPDEVHAAAVDDRGRFTLGELGSGTYGLRAVRDGLELATGDAQAGDALTLRSDRRPTVESLTISVEDGAGRPIAGVQVFGGPFSGAITDREGEVQGEDVVPETYRLRLLAEGCPVETIEITASAPRHAQAAVLPNCG